LRERIGGRVLLEWRLRCARLCPVPRRPLPFGAAEWLRPLGMFQAEPRTLCKFFAEGRCTKGDGCTWLHDVEAPPAQVFTDAPRTPCKFWLSGACKNGDGCTWRHDGDNDPLGLGGFAHQVKHSANSFNMPVYASSLPIGGSPGSSGGGKVKRTICQFWEKGMCQKGDDCTWAHGYEEMGQPAFQEPQSFPSMGSPHPGFGGGAGAEMVVLRTICQFWQNGTCKNGDLCTWAHGEGELGALAPANPLAAASVWNSAQIGGGGYASAPLAGYGKGGGKANSLAIVKGMGKMGKASGGKGYGAPSGAWPVPQYPLSSGGVKRTLCKHWQMGSCKNGALCTWAHGQEEVDATRMQGHPEARGEGFSSFGFGPPAGTEGREKRTICKFWTQGLCNKGDDCTWAHGGDELQEPAAKRSRQGDFL